MTLVKRFLFILLLTVSAHANSASLPVVSGVTLTGDQLSWTPQEGVSGYNVYLDYRYFDTVTDTNTYTVSQPGSYRVVAFNNSGDFSPLNGLDDNGERVVGVVFEGAVPESIHYDYHLGGQLIVYNTCTDVGPGETCIARCPSSYEHQYGTEYFNYMSGGACSTSDIVEADAFVDQFSYRCTVPTFSGEVVAQAICIAYD